MELTNLVWMFLIGITGEKQQTTLHNSWFVKDNWSNIKVRFDWFIDWCLTPTFKSGLKLNQSIKTSILSTDKYDTNISCLLENTNKRLCLPIIFFTATIIFTKINNPIYVTHGNLTEQKQTQSTKFLSIKSTVK